MLIASLLDWRCSCQLLYTRACHHVTVRRHSWPAGPMGLLRDCHKPLIARSWSPVCPSPCSTALTEGRGEKVLNLHEIFQ